MAQQALERADPRTRRVAPGLAGHLRNGRPAERAYILANPNDNLSGLSMHLDSGWTKVNGRKDGDVERVHSGKVEANGDVSFQGQILIWLPREEFIARDQDRLAIIAARDAKKRAPGGIDGVVDAQGKLSQPTTIE